MKTCSTRRRAHELSLPASDSSHAKSFKLSKQVPPDDMLTPPEDPPRRKVSFDLPDSSESEAEYYDSSHEVVSSPPSVFSSSPEPRSFDITGTMLSQEILTALYDRPAEMKDLVYKNVAFFDCLRVGRVGIGEWPKFIELILSERSVIGDKDWIEGVRGFIGDCPIYFERFKNIVGFDERWVSSTVEKEKSNDYRYEKDEDDEDGYFADDTDDEEDRYSNATFETIDLTRIRQFPTRLAHFKRSYPQFFVNAQISLCCPRDPYGIEISNPARAAVKQTNLYDEFVEILFTPKGTMPDDEWERRLLKCLDGRPNILAQLKEIVAYEVGEEYDV